MSDYDASTINAPNPLARFAHRSRVKRSLGYVRGRLSAGKVLDYGCGSGVLVASLLDEKPNCAVGYEPFMEERSRPDLPIYGTIEEAASHGPFGTVTLFETIEHLSEAELDQFLAECDRLLADDGVILASSPIEVGPALLLKEANRFWFRFRRSEHSSIEFLKASLLALPARRAENIKTSHRGFDFRHAIVMLSEK